MNTQYCLLTIGISASGKTTRAKEIVQKHKGNPRGLININRDDLRFSLFGCTNWNEYKFSKAKEKLITQVQLKMATHVVSEGKNIIISDTNLSTKTRDLWKNFCNDHKIEYRELILRTPVEECQKRNAIRANGVPSEVIYQQWGKFNDQFGDKYTPDKSLPEAIICDIDGTLAHMGSRSPYDWEKVGEDTVDPLVSQILDTNFYHKEIILLSGRDGSCRDLTLDWLADNDVAYDKLYMRVFPKDNRPDTVFKKEVFDKEIRGKYNVTLAIDDRPCMVDMWNDLGIKTLAVADQRLRF